MLFFFFYSILLHNTKIFFSYREFAILLFFEMKLISLLFGIFLLSITNATRGDFSVLYGVHFD